jgi:hypothetical protein
MILQPCLEQRCFRCGGWHLLLASGDDAHPHASRYLYVDCPGRGQFKAGRYFAGAAWTASDHPLRKAAG